MTITEVAYCTREMVQRALNLADNPRLNDRVDNAVMAGARQVEGFLHRTFYPETRTIAFDQPDDEFLWLYRDLTGEPEILSGGTPMTIDTDVLLRPKGGPPFRWLEARFSGSVFWQAEDTPQNSVVITGDWGYPTTIVPVATVAGITATAVQLDFSAQVGVGSLILVGAERMIVTGKTFVTTGTTITADLTASKSAVTVQVSDGTVFEGGEMIVIDSERMFVEQVIGNNLTVDRAVGGSALAAHTTGAVPYAPRTASVLRGVLGTLAVSHTAGDTVSLIKAPSLITELNLAYAINNEEQALAAYARTSGASDNQRDGVGRGVVDLQEDVYTAYGVKARSRAVM
jgi:hypothetical protein